MDSPARPSGYPLPSHRSWWGRTPGRAHQPQRSQGSTDPLADHRMQPHDARLFRRQRTWLQEDRLGNSDLAEIVQISGPTEGPEMIRGECELLPELDGVIGQPFTVPMG